MVRPPGFEPGSEAWKASILDQARLWPQELENESLWLEFKRIVRVNVPYRLMTIESVNKCLNWNLC